MVTSISFWATVSRESSLYPLMPSSIDNRKRSQPALHGSQWKQGHHMQPFRRA